MSPHKRTGRRILLMDRLPERSFSPGQPHVLLAGDGELHALRARRGARGPAPLLPSPGHAPYAPRTHLARVRTWPAYAASFAIFLAAYAFAMTSNYSPFIYFRF